MSDNKKVKCTTCRKVHFESDRVAKRDAKYGWNNLVCPACGGKVYWLVLKEPVGRRIIAKTRDEWRASYEKSNQ